jgi:hypothetical protein
MERTFIPKVDAKLLRQYRQGFNDSVWLSRNWERVKKEYPDEWVAVYQKRVADHDRSRSRLRKRLQQKFRGQANWITTTFIASKEEIVIL